MRGSASTELLTVDEKPIGILLEHNYCSEHEWGVADLRRLAGGMSSDDADLNRVSDFSRIRVKAPADVILFSDAEDLVILGVQRDHWQHESFSRWTDEDYEERKCTREMSWPEVWARTSYEFGVPDKITAKNKNNKWISENQTRSAWDNSSFGIASRDPQTMAFLRQLKIALETGDAVIHIASGSNPFKPVSGLVIGIESLVPQEQKDKFKAGYEDWFKLRDAMKDTKIEEKIKKADLRYFALSPRWCNDGEKTRTKYPIVFWLNPHDQHIYNSDWFTVEELEQWISKTGPVLKK
jgi:hypothetical protein